VSTARFMPLFGVFLMTLVLIIYRSWRTLAAIILTLGTLVAIAMGLGDVFGWSHTVISTIVPLTVMVTTTATLVYRSFTVHRARRLADSSRTPCAGAGK
jgi:hypothetical protein